jgi:galactose mutarotase-like enzyme
VTNLCGIPIDFMWGHHPYYCKPVLGRSSRILAPAGTALDGQFQPTGWPMHGGTDLSLCPPEGAGTSEMFYLAGLAAGWYALVNPEARLGLAMAWDTAVFPYVWIWREANKSMDYPYFGGAYTVAIEPFSSLPGARQRGERLLSLDAGATLSTRLCFSAFEGQKEIAGFDLDGRVTPA